MWETIKDNITDGAGIGILLLSVCLVAFFILGVTGS